MVERTIEQHTAILIEGLYEIFEQELKALEVKHFFCGYLKNELSYFCDVGSLAEHGRGKQLERLLTELRAELRR